jgi:alpha-1,2-mannosyltransferase
MTLTVAAIIGGLRNGDWLVVPRMRVVAGLLVVFTVLTLAGLAATANGGVDMLGRPLGTDFSSFYAAGQAVLAGQPTTAYDPALLYAREQALFGQGTPFYGWQYPPMFLLMVAPFAALPYAAALAAWQGVTLLLYLAVIRAIVTPLSPSERAAGVAGVPLWLLLALGFPAVFVTLGHGQNAFLSAALLGGGLTLLNRRPVLAGVLFGLLIYKPQLGLMIPVALIAGGRWRAVVAATTTVVGLAVLVALILGSDVWRAFLASTSLSRVGLLEAGGPGWAKLQTAFAWARLWGGAIEVAYAVQIVVTMAVAAGLAWLWRSAQPYGVKAAALAVATVVGTPFSLDYDMMVLAPAIAFLAVEGLRNGFGPYEKTALAALWLVPLVARGIATATLIPIGFILTMAAFALLVRRLVAPSGLARPAWQASVKPWNAAR